jgi:octaprenyl-diphosphate synthase
LVSDTTSTPPVLELGLTEDWVAFEQAIQSAVCAGVPLVGQVCEYILARPGKRLRSALVLLVSQALNLQDPRRFDLAAIVELIHTATLLHDDVVDESTLRRGQATVNNQFGNAASILVGDFLYSRSFQMMVRLQVPRVMAILADTTNVISEGEVLQLSHVGNPNITSGMYLDIISSKTARLFEASAQLPCVLAEAEKDIEEALSTYGQALGVAFQIVDDVLDYRGDVTRIGKNLGDDLREGKVTLPLIVAMERSGENERAYLRSLIVDGGQTDVSFVMPLIESTDALDASMKVAQEQLTRAVQALSLLPSWVKTDPLLQLAQRAVYRQA